MGDQKLLNPQLALFLACACHLFALAKSQQVEQIIFFIASCSIRSWWRHCEHLCPALRWVLQRGEVWQDEGPMLLQHGSCPIILILTPILLDLLYHLWCDHFFGHFVITPMSSVGFLVVDLFDHSAFCARCSPTPKSTWPPLQWPALQRTKRSSHWKNFFQVTSPSCNFQLLARQLDLDFLFILLQKMRPCMWQTTNV